MMDALRYGVPQLICPGKVFERKYNASSVTRQGAGITLDETDFHSKQIKEAVTKLIDTECERQNSKRLWQEIKKLGGVASIVRMIEEG